MDIYLDCCDLAGRQQPAQQQEDAWAMKGIAAQAGQDASHHSLHLLNPLLPQLFFVRYLAARKLAAHLVDRGVLHMQQRLCEPAPALLSRGCTADICAISYLAATLIDRENGEKGVP